MNKLLLSLALALGVTAGYAAEPAEQKKVCIKTTDAKTKKEIEKCKMVKLHKKLEKVEPTPSK